MITAISFLQCQYGLFTEVRTKGQLFLDTRWEYKVSTWFKLHQVQLMQYFEERNPVCKPSQSWWLLLWLIAKISTSVSKTFRSLQGFSTTLRAQRQGLLKFQGICAKMFNAYAAKNVVFLQGSEHD
jgi:hypothetical protein